MKNTIVVAVDFSPAADNAARYGFDFAQASGADLALIHICFETVPTDIPVLLSSVTGMMEDAENKIALLKKTLINEKGNGVSISTIVKTGFIISEIAAYCETLNNPVVIMGAHVTSATERIIFGSRVLDAMRDLACPLIVVPDGIAFTGINTAGLACDLQHVQTTLHIDYLNKLFNEFHPQLHVLHVTQKEPRMLNEEEREGAKWLTAALKKFNPMFHYLRNDHVEESIKNFSEGNHLNLLVIFPKKHGLFNRLMYKSHSKQMILNAQVPVMSIHA